MKAFFAYIIAGLALISCQSGHAAAYEPASLDLTWQDNSDNEDAFEIERALYKGETAELAFEPLATVGPDVTAYTDTAIEYGQTYAYRVKAKNAFGESGYTNVALGLAEDKSPAAASLLLVVFKAPDGHTYTVDFQADGTPYLVKLP
jgi:hypothetical protein